MRTYLHFKLLALLMATNIFQGFSQVEITIKPGPSDGKDAYVNSWNERNGITQSLIAAAWTYEGIEGVGRSFLEFSLPVLPDTVANFHAHLNLFYDSISGHEGHGGDNACKLERIIENWYEDEITWNNQPAVTSQNAVILPISITFDQDYENIDVTNLVLDTYEHPDSSFGFRLSLLSETIYRSLILSSSDHVDPNVWPSLVIQYDIPCQLPSASFKYTNYNNAFQFSADSIIEAEYWWDFGNNYYSDLKSPSFVFTEAGIFNVCLTVSNNCGYSNFCSEIEVCENIIQGTFTSQSDGNLIAFIPEIVNSKVDLIWDFGDGFFAELDNPIHYYNEPGKYLVSMIAKNHCKQVIFCDSVIVFAPQTNIKSSNVVQLFPNPSTGIISIENGKTPANFLDVKIINFDGTVIINNDHYRLIKQENGYFCDFSGMESGIYTVYVTTDIGTFSQKAIIIPTK